MKVFYFHVAKDIPFSFPLETAVVIDVLRATTTIAWALKNGAEAIEVFSDLEELRNKAHNWPKDLRVLVGERGGKTLEGFDLGNSPIGVVPDLVSGKRLFMSTTNGTKALQRVKDAECLYTVSLPNRLAVAKKIISNQPNNLCILGSGWEGSYSLEDSLAAGALASSIMELSASSVRISNDELLSALALWDQWKDNPEGCLRKATHGQRLAGIGNHDEDFICCSQLDCLSIVPRQKEPGVIRAE